MNPQGHSPPSAPAAVAAPPPLAYAVHGHPDVEGRAESGLPAASAPLATSETASDDQQQHPLNQSEQPLDVLDDDAAASAATSPGGMLTGGKRKRVVLSIHEKQQVLQRLELGEPPAAIARAFGISRQQVSDIKKNRERILAFCVDAKHLSSLQRKTLRATSEFHPGVEQELYRWIIRQRRLQRAITPDALAGKAAELFQQYAAASGASASTSEASGTGHASLKNVANWLRHFKRAHGIKALTDEELEQLPDKFSPAMDMSLAASTTWPGAAASGEQGGIYAAGAASMAASITTNAASSGHAGAPHNALAFGLAHSTAALNIDDVSTFMTASAGAYHPLPHHAAATLSAADLLARPGAAGRSGEGVATAPAGLMGVVESVQHLNAQVGVFERAMALKLDYLDARVEKLCFTVLPARFT